MSHTRVRGRQGSVPLVCRHLKWWKIQIGDPDPSRICTSIVERSNLSIRTSVRRLTRLTNAYSKKRENLRAMLAIYFAFYNFCRIHSSIRCTPAMESGITQHVWTLRDLLTA